MRCYLEAVAGPTVGEYVAGSEALRARADGVDDDGRRAGAWHCVALHARSPSMLRPCTTRNGEGRRPRPVRYCSGRAKTLEDTRFTV